MRWFGPQDEVNLKDIRQAGCSAVVTALHHIPVGEVWARSEIELRKQQIAEAGMTWKVVESLPVHEAIKTQSEGFEDYIEKYKESMRNLALCGIEVITYNFMPLLDWVRTNLHYKVADGSSALRFDKLDYMAFDLFLLKRPGATNEYTAAEQDIAKQHFDKLSKEKQQRLFKTALLGLPGSDIPFTAEQILQSLKTYINIDRIKLQQHLFFFLRKIVPLAEELHLKLAIHPDDPPYSVIGLPRVVSTKEDLQALIDAAPAKANGICYCTGSLGIRPENDLISILKELGEHIHFLHLRNTHRDENGNFYEADHLTGSVNMYEVMKEVVLLERKRDWSIPMRPDHGHQLDVDAHKRTYPGYSLVGRLKGLAELRGLEMGIKYSLPEEDKSGKN